MFGLDTFPPADLYDTYDLYMFSKPLISAVHVTQIVFCSCFEKMTLRSNDTKKSNVKQYISGRAQNLPEWPRRVHHAR